MVFRCNESDNNYKILTIRDKHDLYFTTYPSLIPRPS